MFSNSFNPTKEVYSNSFLSEAYNSEGNFPNLNNAKIAVFFGQQAFSESVRKAFQRLPKHYNISCIDLGSIKSNNTPNLLKVISELNDKNITSVYIGTLDETFTAKSLINDSKPNLDANISALIPYNSRTKTINIAWQRHLIEKQNIYKATDSKYPGLSLGQIRENISMLEPLLRECNYLHFDFSSMRRSESPNSLLSLPTGLYSEEACQIFRYAGESLCCNALTIDTNSFDQNCDAEAMLIAEMLWYFVEGMTTKCTEHPANSNNFREYIIELNEVDYSLIFAQNKRSGKWWCKTNNDKNTYIACSQKEYESAKKNEIPYRILNML